MDRALWVIYLVFAALLLVQAALITLQTWEHRRFARSRMQHLDAHQPRGHASVFCPCKGVDPGLENNLRAILHQDYDDFDVVFVVESQQDPAYALVKKIMAEHPHVHTRVIVAGLARGCGQKMHNLREATADLSQETEFVAFVDERQAGNSAETRERFLNSACGLLEVAIAAGQYPAMPP